MDRFAEIRRNLDQATMTGLEIGPWYSPVAPKAEGWNTVVVDYQDQAALRRDALNHTSENIRKNADRIEAVDIVWTGQPLDEAALALRPEGYDFVIASHVIEHTPDIVAFLLQCSRLLKPAGIISLAVPDMRKCFDILKMPTGIREMLAAHREKRIRHTPETLFEARALGAVRGGAHAWISGTRTPIELAYDYADIVARYRQEVVEMDRSGPYVDAHAWFFTPASFRLAMLELFEMMLLDLEIVSLVESHGSEFFVQMRRSKRNAIRGQRAINEEKVKLAMQHHAEMDAELAPDYRELAPVRIVREAVRVEIPAPPASETMPTRDVAKLLAVRVKRKVQSMLTKPMARKQ